MSAKRRFQRTAKLKQEPAVEDDGIVLQDEESLEQSGATHVPLLAPPLFEGRLQLGQ
jgi:hypothetical protein